MRQKQLKIILALFLLGILFVIAAPYLFTRSIGLTNFNDTGSIGDTIGGITAPIVSLLGSLLVFFALKAQIEANKLVQYQFDQQRIDEIERKNLLYIAEQVSMIRKEINDFTYHFKDSDRITSGDHHTYYVSLRGTNAIAKFLDSINHYGEGHRDEDPFTANPKLAELYNLLQVIDGISDKINNDVKNPDDGLYFKASVRYQFVSKIKPPFVANENQRTKNTEPCERCGKRHYGIPDKIFDLVDSISTKLE